MRGVPPGRRVVGPIRDCHARAATTLELGARGRLRDPPGHDGYTIGTEPCVQIEWSGLRAFAGFRLAGTYNRALVTLLFTDLVDSTVMANRLGDLAWRDLLSTHYEATRAELERHHGQEINTTGDGLLATFDGPANALRCAAPIKRAAAREDLGIRAECARWRGGACRHGRAWIVVHEAARILNEAGRNEILISATTRALMAGSGFAFHL